MEKGYIFDMDGTLIDSMGMISRMDKGIFERLGIPFTEEAAEVMKYIPLGDTASYILKNFDVPYSSKEIFDILIDTMRRGYETVVAKPGAGEYLDFCRSRGISLCIATATEPQYATEVSTRLRLMEKIDFLISCSDVGASKDKPDIFLEAARRMGLEPSQVTVFEDGLPGAASSKRAGFSVVGVYDETASDEDVIKMKSICDRYIMSFDDIKNTEI